MISSSMCRISGDHKLTIRQKILYLVINFFDNYLLDLIRARVPVSRPKNLLMDSSKLFDLSSPGRRLSDIFWQNLPWEQYKRELGALNILDCGCGSGGMLARLRETIKDSTATFTGFDVVESSDWKKLERDGMSFFSANAENFQSLIPLRTNVFISQSALEHFPDDIAFINQITSFGKATSQKILQIHIVPARSCLLLYGLHGYRQYTPKKILELLGQSKTNGVKFEVVALGGWFCQITHFLFTTVPLLFLRKDLRPLFPGFYKLTCNYSIRIDQKLRVPSSLFLAVIVYNNPEL